MKVCVSLVPGGCCRVVLREAGGRVASARGARPGTPRRPSRGGGSRVGVAQGPAGGRTPRLSQRLAGHLRASGRRRSGGPRAHSPWVAWSATGGGLVPPGTPACHPCGEARHGATPGLAAGARVRPRE